MLFIAPPDSFIHVDEFDGPKQLAEYLAQLDKDDSKYMEYFQWRNKGSFLKTKFFCRTCAMMNFASTSKYQHPEIDWNTWWNHPDKLINQIEDTDSDEIDLNDLR